MEWCRFQDAAWIRVSLLPFADESSVSVCRLVKKVALPMIPRRLPHAPLQVDLAPDFIRSLRMHQARVSITASAVRGYQQGTVARARLHLATQLRLGAFRVGGERAFASRLDDATDELCRVLPVRSRSWGVARKLLNIYLRDCSYCRFLCQHYRLVQVEHFLEVPLDSIVAKGLRLAADRTNAGLLVPRWNSVKRLSREDSTAFQHAARALAASRGLARVHLDVVLWGDRDEP
jgi:hypothetical protein